jgi:hypothetical protein
MKIEKVKKQLERMNFKYGNLANKYAVEKQKHKDFVEKTLRNLKNIRELYKNNDNVSKQDILFMFFELEESLTELESEGEK